MCNPVIAAADIGGTHITVALVDMEQGQVINHTWTRLGVDAQADAETVITTWCKAFEESFRVSGITPADIGIAMPGPFDYNEGISLINNQNKYDALYGLNVKKMLADRLGVPAAHLVMTNDAACFLLGEQFGGVAKGYDRVLGLTLGTGLGAARAIDGAVADANLWCSNFLDGIAEDYLSSRWLVQRYFELAGSRVKHVQALGMLARTDGAAQQVFKEFGANLGRFLLPFVLAENISMVVLGGNIAQALPLFAAEMNSVLQPEQHGLVLAQSILGENAILVGAASNCLHAAATRKVPHTAGGIISK